MKLLICGKGGCGKSTLSALLAKALQRRNKKVLVVDADESNIGLYRMLGLELPQTLMESLGGKKGFREKTSAAGVGLGGPPPLFPKEMKIDELPKEIVAMAGTIRVMSVGKIHHFAEGCACPMGRLFRMVFSSLDIKEDEMVIVDAAAGVEHFGRSLDSHCDRILCVVDPSYESITLSLRIAELAKEARVPVDVVLNKVTNEIEPGMKEALGDTKIIGSIPQESAVFSRNLQGKALDVKVPQIEAVCDALVMSLT